jgi:hypothetical protein
MEHKSDEAGGPPRSTWWQTLPHKSTRGQRRRTADASHGQHWHRRAQRGSHLYILAEGGDVIGQRISTERDRFAAARGAGRLLFGGLVADDSTRTLVYIG